MRKVDRNLLSIYFIIMTVTLRNVDTDLFNTLKNFLKSKTHVQIDTNEESCEFQSISEMTENQFNTELEKGYAEILAGKTQPAAKVFESIRRDYNL